MLLAQAAALKMLRKYGISYPRTLIGTDFSAVKRWRFPAVLKVDSPEIMHKSDSGLVFTGLRSMSEVREKARLAKQVLGKKKVKDYRFALQEQVSGVELIVGMKRDITFGPVVIFGIGGVLVEIIKDVSMRIAPLTRQDCIEMIDEIKGKNLLDGYRNMPSVSRQKLIELLMTVSQLSIKEKDISEIDFNPAIADGKRVVVADARIVKDA